SPRTVVIREGRLEAIARRGDARGAIVVDLAPRDGRAHPVVCPAFIDIHAHLREPGDPAAETIASGALAAAAGGFGQVVAMANTKPPIDSPAEVQRARRRSGEAAVRVLSSAAVTKGLDGTELVDIAACAAAGASAFTDDGRNAIAPRLLTEAIARAADVGLPVLVHPEDEVMIAAANPGATNVTRCSFRPAASEVAAVENAIRALVAAGRGRLHLQHVSAAGSVESLRVARQAGLAVTAEVTPHHLAMWRPFDIEASPPALAKVNPPLRGELDRVAVVQALREGVIDCVATDHAPQVPADKSWGYDDAAPGFVGLETALATCITLGAMGGEWLPVLVDRMTAGPWRVLGARAGLVEPRLRIGAPATLTVFDEVSRWTVGKRRFQSLSTNTPLGGTRVRGRVLLTVVDGRVAYVDDDERMKALRGEVEAHA
ncbi:MAG TPA: dihydroorotase, partial [Candidatus Dormibacteraeota bacterium]|nr:dihydroorotase [Candidatus Dormibacteraeota bacterium]